MAMCEPQNDSLVAADHPFVVSHSNSNDDLFLLFNG